MSPGIMRPMIDMLSPAGEARLAQALAGRPLLALDFDGTVSRLVPDPETARMDPAVPPLLTRLATRMPVALVSGRGLQDLRARTPLTGLTLVGNHGNEWDDPAGQHAPTWVESALKDTEGPIVAVSDYMKAVPDQIRPWVPRDYAVLGADGFGFSDTRAASRRYYQIDGPSVVVAVLQRLAAQGEVPLQLALDAAEKYQLWNVNAGTSGSVGGDA